MADLTDVREAVRGKMTGDMTLTGLLGSGERTFHIKARRPSTIPSIAYSDTGSKPDSTVPLHDRVYTMEVWHTTVEAAEIILARLRKLFDGQPLTIAGGGWKFSGMYAMADGVEPLEDGDVVMLSINFRMFLYEVS